MTELLEQRSGYGTALAGLTGKQKQRAFPNLRSRCGQLQAHFRKKCCQSCHTDLRVKNVFDVVYILGTDDDFLFIKL